MSTTLEDLKTRAITEATDFTELKKEVLSLTEDETTEYLYHLIDNEYKLEEIENDPLIKFLKQPEFKSYFKKMVENDTEVKIETDSTEEK